MPTANRITINKLVPTLQNLFFLLVVILGDILLVIFDLYLEAGGAKLALPTIKWPKEMVALLTLIEIPSNYISPAIVLGLIITIASMGGAFSVAHYTMGLLGSVQRLIHLLIQSRQEGRQTGAQALVIRRLKIIGG